MFLRVILIVAASLCFSTGSVTASEPENIIRFCGDDFPPYIITDESAPARGVAVEYIDRIFNGMGFQAEFSVLPWARCEQMLKTGMMDAVAIIRQSPSREEYLVFSEPVIRRDIKLFHKTGRFKEPFAWETYDDLKPYTFVSGRGYSITKELQSYGIPVLPIREQEQAYAMVTLERADFFTDFLSAFEDKLAENPDYQGQFTAVEKPFSSSTYHIAISRQVEKLHLIPLINRHIAELRRTGELDDIIRRH